MPVIQINDKQHTLKPGQTRVGGGPGVDVTVSNDASLGLQAVLELGANNQVVIRRARDGANVRVNGVALGVEPTPLMHGDKVEVAGTEVLFSEDKKVGATQFVSAGDIASIAAKRAGPARATAGTGGRLVSLVDGKEYQIPSAGITFGREAGSDVVVAQPEVSRKHASIVAADQGYVLTDMSTNGVWVNGTRVQGSQLLSRADIVRVGSEEFRFYADVAPAPKPTPIGVSAQPQAPVAPTSRPAATPATPVAPSASASAVAPPTPPAAPAPAPAPTPAASAPPPAVSAVTLQPPPPPPLPPLPQPSQQPPVGQAAPVRAETSAHPAPPAGAPVQVAAAPMERPAPRAESPAAPGTEPRRDEPATAPVPVRQSPKGAAKREPPTAAGAKSEPKAGGVPAWVWIAIIIVVGVAMYFLGQGKG